MASLPTICTLTLSFLGAVFAQPLGELSPGPLSSNDEVHSANLLDSIPSAEIFENFMTAEVGQRFLRNNTMYIFKGPIDTGVNGKRQQCNTNSYQAVQVPDGQSGTWWGSWEPTTGCFYDGKSNGNDNNCQSISSSVTTSWTYSAGFSTSVAGDILDIINANANFNFGYTWGYSTSTSDTIGCCPGTEGVSQIWSQSQYGWSNSQVQTCYYDSCYPSDVSCGAYSAYQHADWALPDDLRTIQYSCSTGYNNVQC